MYYEYVSGHAGTYFSDQLRAVIHICLTFFLYVTKGFPFLVAYILADPTIQFFNQTENLGFHFSRFLKKINREQCNFTYHLETLLLGFSLNFLNNFMILYFCNCLYESLLV